MREWIRKILGRPARERHAEPTAELTQREQLELTAYRIMLRAYARAMTSGGSLPEEERIELVRPLLPLLEDDVAAIMAVIDHARAIGLEETRAAVHGAVIDHQSLEHVLDAHARDRGAW